MPGMLSRLPMFHRGWAPKLEARRQMRHKTTLGKQGDPASRARDTVALWPGDSPSHGPGRAGH
jgi:hypothetical protein